MAEILATLGLAWVAKTLSEKPKTTENYIPQTTQRETDFNTNHRTIVMDSKTGGVDGVGMNPFNKQEMPNFGEVSFMKHVNGEPVRDFRDRPYVSGLMNNLSPVEKNLVGAGLNVGPDVPAYGGYQQLFRVKPNNVGSYKLTTLPGRAGPGGDIHGGRRGMIGQLTHNKPETTSYLPSRHPTVRGRAQGQGGSISGVVPRGEYEKTKRTTNRSETTLRTDGLNFAPAKKFISNSTIAEDPTRNKGDLNVLQYQYHNNPTPNINSFHGGYTNSAIVKAMNENRMNNKTLEKYGLRPSDRRGKNNRKGNAGRMNVRANPINQQGMITSVRSDCSRIDGWISPAAGGWTQNYVVPKFQNNNAYKGNVNPRSSSAYLKTASQQLKNNPFAHSLSG